MFKFHKDRLQTKQKLGSGKFASVFPYQKDTQDFKWVVKRIRADDADALLSSLPEIVLGFFCDHPCMVPVKGYFIEKDSNNESFNIYMKLPRMKETLLNNLKDRKRDKNPYSEQEIIRYFYSLVCGVQYLHSNKIYHGDLKHDNLLIDNTGSLKIADVGIAKHVEEEDSYQTLTGEVGTYQYSAPEIVGADRKDHKKDVLAKADVWSMGVVILELCSLDFRLLNSSLPRDQLQARVNERLASLEGKFDSSLILLIKKMLNLDQKERLDVEVIINEIENHYSEMLDRDFLILNPSYQAQVLKEYEHQIEMLKKQIQEASEKSEVEKRQLTEQISQIKIEISQQKQQNEDQIAAF